VSDEIDVLKIFLILKEKIKMYKNYRVDCYGAVVFCKAIEEKEAINNFRKICLDNKIFGFEPENVKEVETIPAEIKPYECLICAVHKI